MSLSSALFASVTGLDATSTAIQVVGDNIANVNTPGFKERRAEFVDVLGQSLSTAGGFSETGAGTRVARVSQIFTQGSFVSTERGTDLAIEGRGFFVIEDTQGTTYTRAGMFGFDNEGVMVDQRGGRVQGFGIDPITGASTGQLGDVTVQTALSAPAPTTQAELTLNLTPADLTTLPLTFDPTNPSDPTSSTYEFPFTVFDSQGGNHDTTIYFTPTAANTWQWNATLEDPANLGQVIVQGTGTMTFDTSGVMTAVTGGAVNYNFPGAVLPNQPINIDFGAVGDPNATSQVSSPSVRTAVVQDGFAPGTLQGVTIDREGFIVASFSNGETSSVARMALASFPNNEGLQAVGNNGFIESRESGQPLIGDPGTGQFGDMRSNFIENSNVDLAAQFVQLILNQRAFQANTRTVSTTNELLANLVQLGQ